MTQAEISAGAIVRNVASYAGHLLAGTVGAILPTLLFFVPAVMIPLLWAFVGPILELLAGEPFFPLNIVLALLLGWALNRRLGHWFARWVWVLPAICLAYTMATWNAHLYARQSYWTNVRHELFGSGSRATEGLYQFFVTLPFYTSVAYSLGAHFGYRSWRARNADNRTPQTPGSDTVA